MEKDMQIRKALDSDLTDVLKVEKLAFGEDDEAQLVDNLLKDETAKPLLSLLAFENDKAVGHILFTRAQLSEQIDGKDVSVALLAPLAVLPKAQNKGVGGKLIQTGLEQLSESFVELVFVLGHPGYYPKHGFTPAGCLGLDAPYPIPVKDAGAWMVQALCPDIIGNVKAKVICANALDKPEYWQE
ncbi:MAG: N-acetyltransferase [Desulfobacteraceae bacterium]|nr:N-acetyltransferase [Desulfobacteraceae bacterium]